MRTQRSHTTAAIGCVAILFSLVVCTDTTTLFVPHAKAYQIIQTDCGGDTFRTLGDWPVIEMCLNPPGFPGLPNATDPNGSTFTAAHAGMTSAHWMWVREGTSDATLFVDGAAGCGNGTGFSAWYDTNQTNNVWWETTASVQTRCPGAFACTASDEETCNPIPFFDHSARIIAADIAVSHEDVFSVVNQDTLVDCFRTGLNHEWMWLHEIGHAYGLWHDQATVSVMKTGNSNVMRNCHIAQGFHHYPFPDDIKGLMKHHQVFSGTKRNWAGTPWVRAAGGDSIPQQLIPATSSPVFVGMEATIHSYYSTGGWPTSRIFLVPINSSPTFSFTTKVWTLNATQLGSIVNHSTDGTPAFGIESRKVNLGSTLGGASVPVGLYRVWAQVDVNGTTTEPDEGDNVFPTNVTFNRT